MDNYSTILIFSGLIVGGFIIESIISQTHFLLYKKHFKKYHYKFGRYLFYLLFPLTALLFSFFFQGLKVVSMFVLFSLVGVLAEWLAGFTYHMVMGQRLWTYHKYSIGGYTSLFSLPLWGIIGILFSFLGKLIQ